MVTTRHNTSAGATAGFPYVVRNPKILGGEPTVRGTRISVRSIVITYQNYGDVAGVCAAYRLSPDVVEAALAFYDENREEIDTFIRDNELAAYETSDQ
jgi:uncharacterized protein (DUF433 family)